MDPHAVGDALAMQTHLTFAGTETYLLFLQRYPLREFCAFEVIDDDAAWAQLQRALLHPILDAAAAHGHGILTDCMVWRASPDYVERLGHRGVAAVNARAVARTRGMVEAWRTTSEGARSTSVILAADVGPRGDGYAVGPARLSAETVGIVRAAAHVGLPVLVSPTVETDGRLPDGTPLGELIVAVDDATAGAPVGYMANCAHPTHLAPTLHEAAEGDAPWLSRFRGLRANASPKTHAELDDSTTLDRGDPADLAQRLGGLQRTYGFTIVGGCCGTDAEHLRAIARACVA